jgi:hypothetical protein
MGTVLTVANGDLPGATHSVSLAKAVGVPNALALF